MHPNIEVWKGIQDLESECCIKLTFKIHFRTSHNLNHYSRYSWHIFYDQLLKSFFYHKYAFLQRYRAADDCTNFYGNFQIPVQLPFK